MSRVDLSIFDKLCWISTQYLKFLAGQNDARAIFLEGQNGVFQNFYASKPGFTGQMRALSNYKFCADWSWSTLSTKASGAVVISEKRVKLLPWLICIYYWLVLEDPLYICVAYNHEHLSILHNIYWLVLTHYQTTNFRTFQTERVCRRQFQIWRKWKKVIQIGRKHCGKRRNCLLWAISPFPTAFSKALFPRGVKRCHCVGIG